MKSISVFSGAGGMDVGFKRAGFDVIAACELNAAACRTFRANHSSTLLFEGDINDHLADLSSHGDIDMVFGGPPCQGFSVAGRMNESDPRSQLVFSFCALIEAVLPRMFVMENVKSLATHAKFEPIRREFLHRFKRAGYEVTTHILNAKDFGVPQSRERVFFIGSRHHGHSLSFEQYARLAPSVKEVLKPMGYPGSKNNPHICRAKVIMAKNPILRKTPYGGMIFNGSGRLINPDKWAFTLPATMGGNRTPIVDNDSLYLDKPSWVEDYHTSLLLGFRSKEAFVAPSQIRRITSYEAARLQSFPEDYIWHGSPSSVYHQIGNAVPCDLAYAVACGARDGMC